MDIVLLEKTISSIKIKIYDYDKPIFRSIYNIKFDLDENIFPTVSNINYDDLEDDYVIEIIKCYLENYYLYNFNLRQIECKLFLKDLCITHNYINIIQYLDYGKCKTSEKVSFKIGRFTIIITFIFEFLYDSQNIKTLNIYLIDNFDIPVKYEKILLYYLNNIFPNIEI
jgi:hypothetical protein